MKNAVVVQDAGKRYVKYDDVPLLLSRAFRLRAGHTRSELWAIRHIDLDVSPGESVGVIGRNGSGKSTMLRMFAGVTAPTEGRIAVSGRVSPLLSVGVGFHQELTGRENVYVNGLVLGMSRREVDRLFDAIVDFAEIEKFIDTPAKFYSSGMLVRLGFSVAVAARPDVLLVDEVLAVGDVAFQAKCFDRMEAIKAEGTSVLVVSHNMNAIRRICTRVLVVHDGAARFLGSTNDAISVYYDLLGTDASLRGTGSGAGSADAEDPRLTAELTEVTFVDAAGRPTSHLKNGDEALLRIHARFHRDVQDGSFGFVLSSDSGTVVSTDTTFRWGTRAFTQGEEADCEIRFPVRLATGSYSVHAGIRWGRGADTRTNVKMLMFYVSARDFVHGVTDLGASFDIRDGAGSAFFSPESVVTAPDSRVSPDSWAHKEAVGLAEDGFIVPPGATQAGPERTPQASSGANE